MGTTSRKAATLFSEETLAFAKNHKAKTERSARPRRNRARGSFSSPQPSQDRTRRGATDRRQQSEQWDGKTADGRIKLSCPTIEGEPAAVTWSKFCETYAVLAKAAFSKYTFYDWHRALCAFEDAVAPQVAGDLTPDALERFEQYICQIGHGKHRIENMVSRVHHMILWACESGYLNREAFGVGPDYRWPVRDKGIWAQRLAEAVA